MINKPRIFFLAGIICLTTLYSCISSQEQDEKPVRSVVPVTVTSPRTGRMTESTDLIATSAFLVKAVTKSPLTGYVEKCSVSPGDHVVKNQVLFLLRTKEGAALDQDSSASMNINGTITVKAPLNGVVAAIEHPQGDFVQEGDALATLVVPGSLVFLLEVPFEMNNLVRTGQECRLKLPDNTEENAVVKSILPSMSGASQTQRLVLQPRTGREIPENLLARVTIVRKVKNNALILPKSCLLNDEIMKNFWVMKLVSDTLAIKVPVETGLQGTDSIEVVSPAFAPTDRILMSGNYGLGDTAHIKIIREDR